MKKLQSLSHLTIIAKWVKDLVAIIGVICSHVFDASSFSSVTRNSAIFRHVLDSGFKNTAICVRYVFPMDSFDSQCMAVIQNCSGCISVSVLLPFVSQSK